MNIWEERQPFEYSMGETIVLCSAAWFTNINCRRYCPTATAEAKGDTIFPLCTLPKKFKLANRHKGIYNDGMIARVSASQEDYLEVIYDLSHGSEAVRSIDIANLLGVSRASVNKRLSLLKDAGFVEHEPYGLVRLTERGCAVAKNVRERHNALYKFLTDILGVPDETADREACEMEHAISQDTADRLYAYLNKLDKAPGPTDKISKTQRVHTSYDRLIK